MLHFVVGSNSELKLRAVKQALEQHGFSPDHTTAIAVGSGVSEQPFGREEIMKGALWRARQALFACPEATYALGIESGLSPVGCGTSSDYHDQPCVALMARDGYCCRLVVVEWGATLTVPGWMVEKIRDKDYPDLGALVKEQGQKEKDPHKHLTGGVVTRESTMVPPLITVLSAVKEALQKRRRMAA